MKLNPCLSKLPLTLFILCILSALFTINANANIDSDLKKISLKLRYMTCQNQTIYDSDSDFSTDIKNIISSLFK